MTVRAMISRAAAVAMAAALAACMASREPEVTVGGPPSFYRSLASADAQVDTTAAREMISQYRANHGLGPVALDPVLEKTAMTQSNAMAAANKLDHGVRGSLDSRLKESGSPAGLAVENVSAGYHTLAEAFSGWRDSPPHNKNLLAKGVRRMGIATAYAPGTRYKVFWTLVMSD